MVASRPDSLREDAILYLQIRYLFREVLYFGQLCGQFLLGPASDTGSSCLRGCAGSAGSSELKIRFAGRGLFPLRPGPPAELRNSLLPNAPRLKNAERPEKKRPFASSAGRTLSSLPPSGVRRSFLSRPRHAPARQYSAKSRSTSIAVLRPSTRGAVCRRCNGVPRGGRSGSRSVSASA